MKTKRKPIDGTYTNYNGDIIHVYGTEAEVIVWNDKKPTFKQIKRVKLGCFLYKKYMYYLTDFK